MIKKVFVSMKTDGKSPDELMKIQKNLTAAVAENMQENLALIEPCIADDDVITLAENIRRMSEADYVIFFDEWQNTRHCKIQRFCAEEYDIPCIDVELAGKGGENDGE